MMRSILIVTLFLINSYILADEPPSFSEYRVLSDNGHFAAVIASDNNHFELNAYLIYGSELEAKPSWQTFFKHTGYPTGVLANNGKLFINYNPRFDDNAELVTIYRSKSTKTFTAKDFNINEVDLLETISHKKWLIREPTIIYEGVTPLAIKIDTVSGIRTLNLE